MVKVTGKLVKIYRILQFMRCFKLSLGLGSFLVEAKIEADILMISDIFLPLYFTAKQHIKTIDFQNDNILNLEFCLLAYC